MRFVTKTKETKGNSKTTLYRLCGVKIFKRCSRPDKRYTKIMGITVYKKKKSPIAETKLSPLDEKFTHMHALEYTHTSRYTPMYLKDRGMETDGEIGVIVPCYNGLEHLKKLVPSLFQNTITPHKFIFINDCSPDPEVLPWLKQQCEGRTDCIVVENDVNLGFPATVNKGASLCSGHFVILNSDTQVPFGWLERIIKPLTTYERIASATPFSNAASYHSFPFICDDPKNKEFLEIFGVERIDSVIATVCNTAPFYDWPSAHGFCMAINRTVWNEIGGFDAETFGKGYGEECDWSQRAINAGYLNVLVPNLFVAHHHRGSFEPEKREALMHAASQNLKLKHPNISDDTKAYVNTKPWSDIRAAALLRLLLTHDCNHILYLLEGAMTLELAERVLSETTAGNCVLSFEHNKPSGGNSLTIYYRNFRFSLKNVSYTLLFSPDFYHIKDIRINSTNDIIAERMEKVKCFLTSQR